MRVLKSIRGWLDDDDDDDDDNDARSEDRDEFPGTISACMHKVGSPNS